ncbi:hypothetical protein ZWY2020_048848 [Hordeum vulgare]|nr:hypothetical protein ZWY2020_048848 [Hordeum vulgare]
MCLDKFKMKLKDCELQDLGLMGDVFTWRNDSHTANHYIWERLDRAVASHTWRDRFSALIVVNGDPRHSDHRPIIIDTHGLSERRIGSARSMGPHFEARWLEEDGCKEMIKEACEGEIGEHHKGVDGAVKGVMKKLMIWDKNFLGDFEKAISRLKKELEACRTKPIGLEQVRREGVLRFKLHRLEVQRELYWKQRAHVEWLKQGDGKNKIPACICIRGEEGEQN